MRLNDFIRAVSDRLMVLALAGYLVLLATSRAASHDAHTMGMLSIGYAAGRSDWWLGRGWRTLRRWWADWMRPSREIFHPIPRRFIK